LIFMRSEPLAGQLQVVRLKVRRASGLPSP